MFDHHHQSSSAEEPGISQFASRVTEHLGNRISYMRLILTEKIARAYVRHISNGLTLQLFGFFLLFSSTAFGLWLGRKYDDYVMSFAVVGGIYFLLFLLYLILRKSVIDRKMIDSVIAAMANEEEEDEEDEEA